MRFLEGFADFKSKHLPSPDLFRYHPAPTSKLEQDCRHCTLFGGYFCIAD